MRRRLQADQQVTAVHNYDQVNGAIPIPATLSIELGKRISAADGALKYRFVSDLPFRGREPHLLDAFETKALEVLRADLKNGLLSIDLARPEPARTARTSL